MGELNAAIFHCISVLLEISPGFPCFLYYIEQIIRTFSSLNTNTVGIFYTKAKKIAFPMTVSVLRYILDSLCRCELCMERFRGKKGRTVLSFVIILISVNSWAITVQPFFCSRGIMCTSLCLSSFSKATSWRTESRRSVKGTKVLLGSSLTYLEQLDWIWIFFSSLFQSHCRSTSFGSK